MSRTSRMSNGLNLGKSGNSGIKIMSRAKRASLAFVGNSFRPAVEFWRYNASLFGIYRTDLYFVLSTFNSPRPAPRREVSTCLSAYMHRHYCSATASISISASFARATTWTVERDGGSFLKNCP